MPKLVSKYSTPLAGDIILCGASWNVHAQRVLRPGFVADYSHAAIMCSINFGVQAMPDSGVNAFGLHEFLTKQVASAPWKVYRYKEIDTYAATQDDMVVMTRFREAARYFMGQGYNFAINLPEWPGNIDSSQRSFCSQLVARIYKKAWDVRPDSRLMTSTVLPSDLQSHFAEKEDWLEVTSIYTDRMDWINKNQRLALAITSDLTSIETFRMGLEFSLAFQERNVRDERNLAKINSTLSSLDAIVARQYERVTGSRLPPMEPLDMTGHLSQALEQGAQSNWRARNIFKQYQWYIRLRKILLKLKGKIEQG